VSSPGGCQSPIWSETHGVQAGSQKILRLFLDLNHIQIMGQTSVLFAPGAAGPRPVFLRLYWPSVTPPPVTPGRLVAETGNDAD
jgi:hypothetical protein